MARSRDADGSGDGDNLNAVVCPGVLDEFACTRRWGAADWLLPWKCRNQDPSEDNSSGGSWGAEEASSSQHALSIILPTRDPTAPGYSFGTATDRQLLLV